MERLDGAGFASTGELANEQDQAYGDLLVREESPPIYERDGEHLQVIGGSYLDDGKGLCVDGINLESGERFREKHLKFYFSSKRIS